GPADRSPVAYDDAARHAAHSHESRRGDAGQNGERQHDVPEPHRSVASTHGAAHRSQGTPRQVHEARFGEGETVLTVTFLGTSAARPTVERNVSGLAIHREGETLLFECGEGTQRQMMRYGVSFALSEIFFTHFHADHFLGVIGLIRTLGLQTRTEPMVLYGPKGAKKVLGQAIQLGVERVPFNVDVIEVKPGDVLRETGKGKRETYGIHVFGTEHGGGSVGYALREHERPGRFDPDKARGAGVPEGHLWGKLQRGETVELADGRKVSADGIVGPKRPGRLVVFTGDTRPCAAVVDAA